MSSVNFDQVGDLVKRLSKSLVDEVLVAASTDESGKIRETTDGFVAVNFINSESGVRVEDYFENLYTNLEEISAKDATPGQIGLALVAYGAAMMTENSFEDLDPGLQAFYESH